MSADGDSGPGRREVAYRLFAAEFDDASLSYSESDEERAPNYVVTPTGLRVNRLFAVGVVTEVESINEDTLRGRIVDPTGAFVTYAGQYQPEAHAFLDRTMPPAFVAITGKARTFEPEDSDRVFTSVRPESLSEVDSDTRDRWVVSAAQSTLHRIAVCAAALDSGLRGGPLEDALTEAGVDDSLAVGIPRALEHYGTTTAYLEGLRQLAVDALELVADEREEVRSLELAPGEGGEADLGAVPSVDIELAGEQPPAAEPESTPTPDSAAEETETSSASVTESEASTGTTPDSDDTTTETAETTADSKPDTTETTATDSPDTTATEPAAAGSDTVGNESADGEPDIAADSPTETVDDSAPSVEPESEAANGASEPDATAKVASAEDTADEESVDEAGMYQLDDEEREELESEYGSGFSSGNEVDPAGEAGIDVPDVDELAEKAEAEGEATEANTEPASDEPETADELGEFDSGLGEFEDDSPAAAEPATAEESGETDTEPVADDETAADDTAESPADADASTDTEPATDEPPAEDIDLEETVVGTMAEMDDGDGVDRAELVASVVESYGVEDAAVEEAIDDALMGGRCYEPGEGVLKAI